MKIFPAVFDMSIIFYLSKLQYPALKDGRN